MKVWYILQLISLKVIVWDRHADTWSWLIIVLNSPVERRKYFYLNNYHNNGMITVTSALKICKLYIFHMSALLTYGQILHCLTIHYILKLTWNSTTSNCFSHYYKYSTTVTSERLAELGHDMFMSESTLFWEWRFFQILFLRSLNTSSKTGHTNSKAHVILTLTFFKVEFIVFVSSGPIST